MNKLVSLVVGNAEELVIRPLNVTRWTGVVPFVPTRWVTIRHAHASSEVLKLGVFGIWGYYEGMWRYCGIL